MILTYQKGRGKKIHLLIDDEYKITTDIDFWADNFIKNGTEISESEFDELCSKISYRKALNKAFDCLSRRDYSRFELKQKLRQKIENIDEIEKAIERVEELGYINDEKYAKALANDLITFKKLSISRVKLELKRRGIDKYLIEDAIALIDVDVTEQIISLIENKYSNKIKTEKGFRQTFSALQRKGYSYSDIKSAFNRFEEIQFEQYEE